MFRNRWKSNWRSSHRSKSVNNLITLNWIPNSQPKIDSKNGWLSRGRILHLPHNSSVEYSANHFCFMKNRCLVKRSQRNEVTRRWIQTLWNLSLLGFSICLQALNSSCSGMESKTYWKWEDCDLMDSWGTLKNEFPSMEHILLQKWVSREIAGFEAANWWKVGKLEGSEGRDLGTVGKQLDRPRISKMPENDGPRISPKKVTPTCC